VLGSIWITVARREPCFVRWKDGAWIHYYGGEAIPHWRLGGPVPLKSFTAGGRDIYLYEYTPCAGDVVFDVGAGIGMATLLFSRLVGSGGRVVALEAHPGTYEWLDRLCRVNRLTNVAPLQVAASASEGELMITDFAQRDRNTVLNDREGIRVPARPLDDIAKDLGIAEVDLVKMNIEGAEQLAIEGMRWLIERTRHVCISCHDFIADDGGSEHMRTKALVQEFLLDHGFRVITRQGAREPWTRDYLYGVNESIAPPARATAMPPGLTDRSAVRARTPMSEDASPTFSVVMPAYNSASTIAPAIQSVQRQTRGDFELIVVDDGSTDDTASRVEPFLSDPRIRLISQQNLGQAGARNVAIAASSGRFVSLLDSDDVWLPFYLEEMAATLDANPTAAVAYTDAWVLDDVTRRIERSSAMSRWHPPSTPEGPEQFLHTLLERGNYVFVGATVHRAVLVEVGAFRLGIEGVEDYELWLRIAAHGYEFTRCPLKLAIYRRRPGQTSANFAEMTRAARDVFRIVAEEYALPADLSELARVRMHEREQQLATLDSMRPRRVPRLLRRPYKALSRARHFRLRAPKEVREAFPDLTAL
jgi:FkbM family methyltransferase